MPTSWLTFGCGPASIVLHPSGSVLTVVHRQRPGVSCLRGGRPFVRIAGVDAELGEPHPTTDVDEAEFAWSNGSVRVEIRHSFTAGWGVRTVVSNPTDRVLEIEDAGMDWAPEPGWCVQALAAGATGAYAVFPADADGPLLGGSLRVGTFQAVSATSMSFGAIRLLPSARYVVQWQWDWYANPRAFDAPAGSPGGRHPTVPRSLYLLGPETARLSVDDDTALVLPDGVWAEVVDGATEINGGSDAATYPVRLLSARGETRYDLHWTGSLEDRLWYAADQALAGPPGPNGVPVLADVHAALAVQHALQARMVDEPVVAEDALEAYVARVDGTNPTPALVSLLTGEAERTSVDDLLAEAGLLVADHDRPCPGLGMAAMQLCVARLMRNLDMDAIAVHMGMLGNIDAGDDLAARAARVELLLVSKASGRELADLGDLGRALGAGLTGVNPRPVPPRLLAHLAALLTLATPTDSAAISQGWAMSGHELGRHAEAEALFRTAHHPPGPVLSLLLMARAMR